MAIPNTTSVALTPVEAERRLNDWRPHRSRGRPLHGHNRGLAPSSSRQRSRRSPQEPHQVRQAGRPFGFRWFAISACGHCWTDPLYAGRTNWNLLDSVTLRRNPKRPDQLLLEPDQSSDEGALALNAKPQRLKHPLDSASGITNPQRAGELQPSSARYPQHHEAQ